jgi:triosephosphate isomerase
MCSGAWVGPAPVRRGQRSNACLVGSGADFAISAQNCYSGKGGAFTGEITADMVADAGLGWVILGHSERRHTIGGGESNEFIAAKCKYAMDKGLKVCYCIGEKQEEREGGTAEAVCSAQMAALKAAGVTEFGERLVIAYEPVWAIGTGLTATPAQAQEMHAFLRGWISSNISAEAAEATRIQYGGSVKPGSSAELSSQPDIDGFLVGGAALTVSKRFHAPLPPFQNPPCIPMTFLTGRDVWIRTRQGAFIEIINNYKL